MVQKTNAPNQSQENKVFAQPETMKLFLSLLLSFCCIEAFHFPTPLSFKRASKPFNRINCVQTGAEFAPPATLYSLPNTLAPVNDVISFIQWWGKKQSVQKDSVVVAQVIVMRERLLVLFCFPKFLHLRSCTEHCHRSAIPNGGVYSVFT